MLELRPVSLNEANTFVAVHHRHHKPVRGHKFSLGCMVGDHLVGVAIIGRPVSRYLDNGMTLEVNRLCTDETRNACSFLYGAAARAAKTMGHKKSSLTFWIRKVEPAFGRQAGNALVWLVAKCGLANGDLRNLCIRRK